MESEVKPAFKKFDSDGSNAISRDEFTDMMKDLGSELNEEQVSAAMEDLDVNHDGVIDFEEFTRWYFTGMKSYSAGRRTFLKMSAKSSKLFDAIGEEAKNALMKEEIKYKKNQFSVAFNAPANP